MSDSAFSRFWDIVKPPAAGNRPPESAQHAALRRRQRRLIAAALFVALFIAAGIGVVGYISTAPQRADREYQAGEKLMHPGAYPDAIVHFTKALAISPDLPAAYLDRGNAHRILAETDAALADYQAAVDLDFSLTAAHDGMALIYLDRHDQRRALSELDQSISLHPTINAYFQRGQILEAQGEHQKAIDDFDRAIELARDAPYIYYARAAAKASLGDAEGAHQDRLTAARLVHP